MRKPVRWLILLVWLAMVSVFVWREVRHPKIPAGLEMAAASAGEGQEWYGLYVEEPGGERVKIGYAATERSESSSGYITRASTYMKLAIQGTERVIRTESKVLTGFDHRLQYIDFSLRSDLVKFQVLGTLRGNELQLEVRTAGGMRKQTMTVPEAPLMPDNLAELLASRGGLKVGTSVELPFFDPSTFRYDKARVQVVDRLEYKTDDGRVVVGYRVETNLAGATAVTLVDEQGRTLEQQLAGIVMVREPHETALTEGWRDRPVDLPELASVKVDRLIPDPRRTGRLQVRLQGVDLSDLELADERQTFADGVLTVQVPPLPAKGSFAIPYPDPEPQWQDLLRAEPLLEVDDPAIREKAAEIAPPGADALAAARAVHRWVFENLQKKPLISMTSAKDVLLVRRGDCNEHAALFTALARAAGLPAKIHVGLVYLNGAFYYHAWNGVYVGEWISVDPTFGQFPADATHLRIVSGGLDRQVDLVRLMGHLNIQVLEFQ